MPDPALPPGFYTPREINALGRRVAGWERKRQAGPLEPRQRRRAEAVETELDTALKPVIGSLVNAFLRRREYLRKHQEDLIQEARMHALRCARRYDGKRRLTTYLYSCVTLELKDIGRVFMSTVGAKVPEHGRHDLTTAPFQEYSPLENQVDDLDAPADARMAEMIAARKQIMMALRRLTFDERQVLMKLYGIHEQRASQDRWATQRARRTEPLNVKAVARHLRLSIDEVERLHAMAQLKIRSFAATSISALPCENQENLSGSGNFTGSSGPVLAAVG